MRKLVLAAVAAGGLAGNALAQAPPQAANPPAEKWIYVGMTGGSMGWEASAEQRDAAAGTVEVLRFMYFRETVKGAVADYNWMFQEIQFNCKANTFSLLSGVYLDKAREDVAEDEGPSAVRPVGDNTPEDILKAVLCDRANLLNAREATSIQAAMDGAEKAVVK
jgi:hypothetical protein